MKRLVPLIMLLLTSFNSQDSIDSNMMHQEKNSIKKIVRTKDQDIDSLLETNNSFKDDKPYRVVIDNIVNTNSTDYTSVKRNVDGDKYVLIINSSAADCDNGQQFENNISEMYDAFLMLGIPKTDIFVLKNGPLEKYVNSGRPITKNFMHAINKIKKKITDKDLLILYFTGHGGSSYAFKDSPNKHRSISASDINKLSEDLNPGALWLIYAPCMGYGMTQNVRGNVIGNSFASPDFFTSGGTSHNFARILRGIANNKEYIDLNGDGKYSIAEIVVVNALTYPNTLSEVAKTSDEHTVREIHYLTYENVNPSKILIK